ncbi:MAG: lyase family protein [Actinomycetota bacterium]|nr:lyase family protein [Actinomycetota bacterium]
MAAAVRAVPCPPASAVLDRERVVGHDVVAFLQLWTEAMPAHLSARVHRGATSSDIVDTGWALALRDATRLLRAGADRLVHALAVHALAHRDTVRVGRTHGQQATVDVWGHRVADFALAADRARTRLDRAGDAVAVAKFSGPTGAYLLIPPDVEFAAARTLDLRPPDVATQVVMRDGLAEWMFALAMLATICEAIALEVRLGQRTEVAELAEGRPDLRAGSSAMPHKRNPITSEKICGLARLVRAYVNPVMEGVPLWHERDLTHSSVERVVIADAAALTEHVALATASVVENLVVDAAMMRSRVEPESAGLASHRLLVALGDAGVGWSDAWSIVQQAWAEQPEMSARELAQRAATTAASRGHELRSSWAADVGNSSPDLDAVFVRVERLLIEGG